MITKEEILQQAAHLKGAAAKRVRNFVERFDESELCDDKNYSGHIRAGAVIFYDYKILLLHNTVLDSWAIPSADINSSDNSITDGLLRQIELETGITPDNLTPMNVEQGSQYCVDIESHYTPYNDAKAERAHLHHEFRFLFHYNGNSEIKLDKSENDDYKWLWFLDESLKEALHTRVFEILLLDMVERFDTAQPSTFNQKRKWLTLVHLVSLYKKSGRKRLLKSTVRRLIAINEPLAKEDKALASRLEEFKSQYSDLL